jgi:phospholipid/cholesterol/gamma-HCH transport system permease protein
MTASADSELLAWDESSGRRTLTVRGDWTLDN